MRVPGLLSVTSAHRESPPEGTWEWVCVLGLILAVAALLRTERLGKPSYSYDEVVMIRIATAPDMPAMVRVLDGTDATRAILYPILLHAWVKVFGSSEGRARAFSVVCGVLTVAWIGRLGRILCGDRRIGLWAASLAALSPALIYHSREVRMYALLALLTCAAWDALVALRNGPTFPRLAVYAIALTALMYSDRLGLSMVLALGLASLIVRRELGLSWKRWSAPYLAAALGIAPWIRRYFDQPPEPIVGRRSLTTAFDHVLGFLGGNRATLFGFLALMVIGLLAIRRDASGRRRIAIDTTLGAVCLLCWLLVPTLLFMFVFKARPDHRAAGLFVAPAYILLVASGLGKLPRLLALCGGLAITALSAVAWPGMIFAPDLNPDWRAAAAALDRRDPSRAEPVFCVVSFTLRDVEIETASYYLSPHRKSYPVPRPPGRSLPLPTNQAWLAFGVRDGKRTTKIPDQFRPIPGEEPILVSGLCLIAVEPDPRAPPPKDAASP